MRNLLPARRAGLLARHSPPGRRNVSPMPKFKVESASKHSAQDTYQKIKSFLENDRDLRKMDSSYVCNFNDSSLSGSAKGSKFEAAVKVAGAGSGANVEIEVSLPLMLTPLKGVVQSTLQKKLESALA